MKDFGCNAFFSGECIDCPTYDVIPVLGITYVCMNDSIEIKFITTEYFLENVWCSLDWFKMNQLRVESRLYVTLADHRSHKLFIVNKKNSMVNTAQSQFWRSFNILWSLFDIAKQ